METVNTFIAAISFSTVLIWLGKFIISSAFNAGIEKYKSELVKQVEEYKANLIILNQEHQVKFTKLHEERASKIKLIYALVIDVESALVYSTEAAQGGDYGTDIKRDIDALNTITILERNFDKEQIFFTMDTVSKVQMIIKEAKNIIYKMNSARRNASEYERHINAGKKVPDDILTEVKQWPEAQSRIDNEFKQLKADLGIEFRQLLGIK